MHNGRVGIGKDKDDHLIGFSSCKIRNAGGRRIGNLNNVASKHIRLGLCGCIGAGLEHLLNGPRSAGSNSIEAIVEHVSRCGNTIRIGRKGNVESRRNKSAQIINVDERATIRNRVDGLRPLDAIKAVKDICLIRQDDKHA